MENWIVALIILGGTGIGLGIIAMMLPREKVLAQIKPSAIVS